MRRKSGFPAILIIFLAFAPAAEAAAASGDSPTDVVRTFQTGLLSVMKAAKDLGVRGRYERLTPMLDEAFHIPLMIRIATGPYWDHADDTQKTRLVAAFRRMSTSTLATLFDGWSGQIFKVTGENPGPQKTTIVKTKLVETDGDIIDIAYVAKKLGGHWRLVDVVVDNGISELSVRKSEYLLLLKTKGVDGLIGALNTKADQLTSPESKK